MKQLSDKFTYDIFGNGRPSLRGRPREYDSNAERQRAYRNRCKLKLNEEVKKTGRCPSSEQGVFHIIDDDFEYPF